MNKNTRVETIKGQSGRYGELKKKKKKEVIYVQKLTNSLI